MPVTTAEERLRAMLVHAPVAMSELEQALVEAAEAERERIRAVILTEQWSLHWKERELADGSIEAVLDTEAFAASILDATDHKDEK